MERIIFISLAFAFLLKPVFPVADYILRFDYISKELCVNKDNANLGCKGKCYLKSELADSSESPDPGKQKTAEPDALFFVDPLTGQLTRVHLADYPEPHPHKNLYESLPPTGTFHPPTC